MKNPLQPLVTVLLMSTVVGLICFGLAFTWCVQERHRADRAEASRNRQNDWFNQQFKVLVGGTAKYGDYNLISFDKGKTWYSWVRDGGGISPADPELVKELNGFDAMMSYVNQHGPINPLDPEGAKILEAAGFTITDKREPQPKP